jgi:hypothetical protein
MITLLKLRGDQECSYRLGFDKKSESELSNVCCVEVYNIAWAAIKSMVEVWNYVDRVPHYDELHAIWYGEKLNSPFRTCDRFFDIARVAKAKIRKFYVDYLGREPNHDELMGAFRQAFIDPDFHFNWKIKDRKKDGSCTKHFLRINYDNRGRKDMVKLCDRVEIGRCMVCNKPVFVYDNSLMLVNAGEIRLLFGFGSQLDNHYGTGFVHDLCAARLDQRIFKHRLDWGYDNRYKVDLKRSKFGNIKLVKTVNEDKGL